MPQESSEIEPVPAAMSIAPEPSARRPMLSQLTGAIPDQMLQAVGYYGPAAAAPAAFARLSAGLNEAIVRVITARPGLEPVIQAMAALTPALIRSAQASLAKPLK